MGIWDNVKTRLGMGNGHAGYQDYEDYTDEHAERGAAGDFETYGAYDDGDGETNGYRESSDGSDAYGQDDYGEHPVPMRSYGVDRADYYNDNHPPIVTQTDVRSQPLPVTTSAGQVRSRVSPARTSRRSAHDLARPVRVDDALAFKDGLARTPNSLAQLQSERLRMENTDRIVIPQSKEAPAAPLDPLGDQVGVRAKVRAGEQTGAGLAAEKQPSLSVVAEPTARYFGQAPIRSRVHRRIEHIRPMSYGDAEQVALELKKGVVVVLDLRTTRPELAKRILDFSFGVASALEGQVDRHLDRVYAFSRNGPLTDEERAAIRV
ncbi:MAG: cell division protein SepF [Coriobacteriales bacterium]|jgi:cell division inhibitor SepF|nr:cell division protein SepF [Coriobacteriales bacterium]